MSEKQVKINITKIYNWSQENQQIELQLQFYSKLSQHLISRKIVRSEISNNYANVDINLKIRYTEQQNIIIIVVTQISNSRLILGEVQVDLDQLSSQKIKYYTFGTVEKILQIQFSQTKPFLNQRKIRQPNEHTLFEKKEKHRKFLQGRKQFLQDYKYKQNKLKNQFQQRIITILQQQSEPRKRPQRKRKNVNFLHYVQNDDQIQERDAHSEQKNKRELDIGRARSAIHQSPIKRQKRGEVLKSTQIPQVQTPIRKHKLVLNTLNIVPKQDSS